MARRRDFARGAVAIRQRRLTTWFQFQPAEVTLAAASTGAILFSLNAAALALRPFTIVRSRFLWSIRSDQAAAIELQSVGLGMAVVSDEAATVGVTAVPTPITEMASSLWFVHDLQYSDESNLTDRTRPQSVREVDSKAMRKVEVGQDIIIVLETSAVSSGAIVQVGGRLLIKNN